MAKIKGYTNLEQSKKLAEILPFESADMAYYQWKGDGYLMSPNPFVLDGTEEKENGVFEYVPCWSLASLLNVLPLPDLIQDKSDDELFWQCSVYDEDGKLLCEAYDSNLVDACYELIVKLYESNLL